MSETSRGQRWLDAGIQAWREGEAELARDWLGRAVLEDENDDRAWWWLALVSPDPAEQKRCLENVLALDPDNEAVRDALARAREGAAVQVPLPPDARPPATTEPREVVVRREVTPVSPAAAMLYPERWGGEWRVTERPPDPATPSLSSSAHSTWDDVWSHDEPLCAYCATPISMDDRRCSGCRRSLVRRDFRYARASTHLTFLFVIVLGLAQIYFIQALYAYVFQGDVAHAVVSGLFGAIFLGLAAAVVLRWPWVHTPLMLVLGLVVGYLLLRPLVPLEMALLRLPGLDPSIAAVARPLPGAVAAIVRALQAGTAALALLWAVWFAAPDFERESARLEARLRRGLTAADQYDATARRLARAGMWAAAIVHWQRAVAMEPLRVPYQQSLATGFARLGFAERALDILDTAERLARDEQTRGELEALRAQVVAGGG